MTGSATAGRVLFSHPKDFTPVCTTELGHMARLKHEFDKRNAKLIGISVDPVDQPQRWKQRHRGDPGPRRQLSDDRRPRAEGRQALRHAPADAARSEAAPPPTTPTVRTVFIIGPDKKIKLMLTYPMTTGRNFDEILRVIDCCSSPPSTRWRRRPIGSRARM